MNEKLFKICDLFQLPQQPNEITPYGNGHINGTYSLVVSERRYILQRINGGVFTKPEEVMENIGEVTAHLKIKITENGGNPERETLTVVPSKSGKSYAEFEGEIYRIYLFIENSVCFDIPETPEMFCSAAEAFGNFQKMLADFDASRLNETIPDFHNTKKRFERLLDAANRDPLGRVAEVGRELEFVKARKADCAVIVDAIEKGEIPLRVTHNDTKLNNLLFDRDTKKALCVIDLDTVMSGSLLYDFGDAIRVGAATASEDEPDLSLVRFDIELYNAYVKGYTAALSDSITERERELLPFSAKLMTLECGMRFLTDYIEGDVYFPIKYEKHNLIRAVNQFKLVEEIEKKIPLLAGL